MGILWVEGTTNKNGTPAVGTNNKGVNFKKRADVAGLTKKFLEDVHNATEAEYITINFTVITKGGQND